MLFPQIAVPVHSTVALPHHVALLLLVEEKKIKGGQLRDKKVKMVKVLKKRRAGLIKHDLESMF